MIICVKCGRVLIACPDPSQPQKAEVVSFDREAGGFWMRPALGNNAGTFTTKSSPACIVVLPGPSVCLSCRRAGGSPPPDGEIERGERLVAAAGRVVREGAA